LPVIAFESTQFFLVSTSHAEFFVTKVVFGLLHSPITVLLAILSKFAHFLTASLTK